jgi:bacterioferritin-associated ferredoxin
MYICICHAISKSTIAQIITKKGTQSLAELQQQCRAGTNCGSCVAKLLALLKANKDPKEASEPSNEDR